MNKKYKNPPIIEAVCEFRFDPTSPWDPTIPGLLYEKIRNTFPKKKKLQIHELMFTVDTKEGLKQQQQLTIKERAQFLREDEKLFVQVDENLLAINHLKPYSSWNEFSRNIQEICNIYQAVAKPKGVQRIGLRFINQIELPKLSIELKDYFNFYPSVGEKLPQTLGSVMVGTMFVFQDGRDVAKVQLMSKKTEKEKSVFILDIDYFLAKPDAVALSEVQNWVDSAHTQVENIFEGALTEETKKLFE